MKRCQPRKASKKCSRSVAFLFFSACYYFKINSALHINKPCIRCFPVYFRLDWQNKRKSVSFFNWTSNGQQLAAFANFIFNSVYCHVWVFHAPNPLHLLYSCTPFCPSDVCTVRIAGSLRCRVGFQFFRLFIYFLWNPNARSTAENAELRATFSILQEWQPVSSARSENGSELSKKTKKQTNKQTKTPPFPVFRPDLSAQFRHLSARVFPEFTVEGFYQERCNSQ